MNAQLRQEKRAVIMSVQNTLKLHDRKNWSL